MKTNKKSGDIDSGGVILYSSKHMDDNKNLEKRGIRRQPLFLYLKVHDHNTRVFLGYLTDISSDGLMLLSENPIDLRKQYVLEIDCSAELPPMVKVILGAQSIWTSEDANPRYMITGFQLTDMDDASLNAVNKLMDTYGFMT